VRAQLGLFSRLSDQSLLCPGNVIIGLVVILPANLLSWSRAASSETNPYLLHFSLRVCHLNN
jgi:hypothetical protein